MINKDMMEIKSFTNILNTVSSSSLECSYGLYFIQMKTESKKAHLEAGR